MAGKLFLAVLMLLCAGAFAQEFLLRIVLVNSHTEDVWLGCQEGASAKYDRRVDIFAPPPGMQTGMVTMPSPDGILPTLYKDVRAPVLPQSWELNCQPFAGKAIELSWTTANVPAGVTLRLKYRGKELDMRETTKLSIVQSTTAVITATAVAPAAKTAE